MAISYHTDQLNIGKERFYAHGFQLAPIIDLDRIARCMTRFVWSPIVWKDGRRLGSKFEYARLLALDFDDGSLSLAQAQNIWCDAKHVIGTTKSHQKAKDGAPPCDRFRVVLVFDKPIDDLAHYVATMAHYTEIHGADRACKDGARLFWPCKEIVSVQTEGYGQDILNAPKPAILDYRKYVAAKTSRYEMVEQLPRWVSTFLAKGAAAGRQHRTAHGVAVDLAECGWTCRDIFSALSQAPMKRPWGTGEIERIVKHAVELVKTKESNSGERQSAEGAKRDNLQVSSESDQPHV